MLSERDIEERDMLTLRALLDEALSEEDAERLRVLNAMVDGFESADDEVDGPLC